MSRNVGKNLPTGAAQYPTRSQENFNFKSRVSCEYSQPLVVISAPSQREVRRPTCYLRQTSCPQWHATKFTQSVLLKLAQVYAGLSEHRQQRLRSECGTRYRKSLFREQNGLCFPRHKPCKHKYDITHAPIILTGPFLYMLACLHKKATHESDKAYLTCIYIHIVSTFPRPELFNLLVPELFF